MPRNFEGSSRKRFLGSNKNRCFLKTSKWQHKLVQEFKRQKLVSYFLNHAAKTCSYGLKIYRTLKSSMYFILKNFFILVILSTQVTSGPSREEMFKQGDSMSRQKMNECFFQQNLEAATRGVLWKKVFLEITQNSKENACARVFLPECFSVNFAEFLRTPFLQNTSERLPLKVYDKIWDGFCLNAGNTSSWRVF